MKNIFLLIFIFLPITIYSQILKGKVMEKTGQGVSPLAGASVYWSNTSQGTKTNNYGEFEISTTSGENKQLVVSFVGYKADTIEIHDEKYITVVLEETRALNEVTITGRRADTYISKLNPIKTEVITQGELAKDACCDLAGCFNTQASVQPTTTNVVTDSKELRILGLSGVYNQVLIDGMPLIQGLSYTYGISSFPGTLINSIHVSKGANSVVQGFESISGQINVELKDPDKTERLLVNAYMNSFYEKQFNLNYSNRWKKWSNITALQTVQPADKFDRDSDSFVDLPLLNRYLLYSKFKFGSEDSLGFTSTVGIRYLNEQRMGGQKNFNFSNNEGDTTVYGQTVKIQQPEIYSKLGYRFDHDNKLSFFISTFYHTQNAWFGETNYKANQTNFYSNAQYELKWREKHDFKTGVSLRHQNLEENIGFSYNISGKSYGGKHLKNELITGVFAENVFRWLDNRLLLMTGVRIDNHNKFGNYITPRTLIKYEINEKTNVRGSLGYGWRTVNLFSENIYLLASQRDIIFTEALKPEKAINYGVNFTHNLDGEKVSGTLGVDFYQTKFQNQIFPDFDTDPTKAYIGNFSSPSVSNGFQAESNLKFYQRFSFKLAYNYLDVYRKENGKKYVLPFNSKHKILTTFSYKPLNEKWHIDANLHWFGEQKLPNTSANPTDFQRPDKSQAYTVVNTQFTRKWRTFDAYFGCENIFDFRQRQPIISWQNPFNPYFDTSSVWGPTRGREFYMGIRFRIE